MTIALDANTPCVKFAHLFQNPLLEDGETKRESAAERRQRAALMSRAVSLCAGCPFQAQCLTDAVVHHDVAGVVAGTTEEQRLEIRDLLGVSIDPVDNDPFAGVNSGRAFNQEEIQRLRAANPTQPLSAIAARLGCSISTVKRHLRKAAARTEPRASVRRLTPSRAQVMAAAAEVLGDADDMVA
ncbi:MAG: WhiB family transcriptional regulator [Arachnia propionica]|uniref:WhiB family transcriptional regulator n=1 Tax=Arachnia propionica TaxID=1750 RepID=UPI002708D154|nr:WhiB family transcriptional regulator [Arachnia propionica]